MNDLQRKVLLRTKYLVDKNEGAVNRVIHGGKYAEEIDAYERARAKIAKSEFALPVEEYMGKVQDISRAKDAIKESKRQKLLKALSQPVEVVEDIAENVVIEQPDILSQIKQKPRSAKAKAPPDSSQLEQFKERANLRKYDVLEYIKKNVPKKDIIKAIEDKGITVGTKGKVDEDGISIKPSKIDLSRIPKDRLFSMFFVDNALPGKPIKTYFTKQELLNLAKISKKGERIGGSIMLDRGDYEYLLRKMKPEYDPAPSCPDPLLAEQAAAAKGKMPVDKSNSMDSAKKGLEAYHRFRKSYSAFPQYGEIMDRKKTMSDAFKIYKKLMAKHEDDHEKAMKKLLAHVVDVSQKSGGYGVPYAKRMASLARKDTYV